MRVRELHVELFRLKQAADIVAANALQLKNLVKTLSSTLLKLASVYFMKSIP